ncbi:uncharacterized protein LOC128875945 isoform X1 [Hylaeus volcanicus]|uniref:uncharacterized protein LOC128875945 isoform X1 n=2 Tax=Hylaeus volcanicus TaxID=313075 RepID=UPI0023B7E88B|nr:uncharacterized protein LOC128875945 isoform X1 [Hylaeus volcanicus]
MSQVCPSSSHQLVAASIAFQRARRKFPKNYGLYGNQEVATNLDKTESVMANEPPNDQENQTFTSKKCPNGRSSPAETKPAWSDDCGENSTIKENLLQKPIICSCCRKRNEAARANEPSRIFKTRDQCSAGDALDVVPNEEYNGIAKKGDLSKSVQPESCAAKTTKSFITESRNSSRGRTSVSHSRRRSPKETSTKLDSVNLLYDRAHDQEDSVKGSSSSEKRNCNARASAEKSDHRISRSKLNLFDSRKNDSNAVHRTHDFHCAKHSTVDLLRSRRDYCRSQNRHRCHHLHNCCHQRYDEEHHSCLSKEKPRLVSDTCLCSSNTTRQKGCCNKSEVKCESFCHHDCCLKDLENVSTVQEQNDEEYDDCVATISHKDSLCILVEKYKASKRCKHKKWPGETEFMDERTKDECCKSFTSEISQMEENVKQREKYFDSDNYRFRDNRMSIGKACRGDYNQLKNLRSRLVKTGTCCSAKGTPWRHTF